MATRECSLKLKYNVKYHFRSFNPIWYLHQIFKLRDKSEPLRVRYYDICHNMTYILYNYELLMDKL